MLRYRIKVVEDGNGQKKFFPQFKGLFFWNTCFHYGPGFKQDARVIHVHLTEFEALRELDYLVFKEKENQKIKVTYIQYP